MIGSTTILAKTKLRRSSLESGPKPEGYAISFLSRPRYLCLYYQISTIFFSDINLKQYSSNFKHRKPNVSQQIMYIGNNSKSLHLSVEASLKKLRTSYIDLLYVHWWDWETSVEEVMRSLHHLVAQGKVIYLVRRVLHIIYLFLSQRKF